MENNSRSEEKKTYYQTHKIEFCKKLLDVYCFNAISRIKGDHESEVDILARKYPYNDYCVRYFKKLCRRYRVSPSSILRADCEEACLLAYLYAICQCSIKEDYDQYILPYIYKVMRIYFCAALVLGDESAIICRRNGLQRVSVDDYGV